MPTKSLTMPYHQEQILAIYLEEELILQQKKSLLLVRQFAPHLKRKSSGILLYYDTGGTSLLWELGLYSAVPGHEYTAFLKPM